LDNIANISFRNVGQIMLSQSFLAAVLTQYSCDCRLRALEFFAAKSMASFSLLATYCDGLHFCGDEIAWLIGCNNPRGAYFRGWA
jgi:hypothetical protein